MLWVSDVLLLFCLNTETNSSETEYAFLQRIKCTPALNEVNEGLACVQLACISREEDDHGAVTEEELNN